MNMNVFVSQNLLPVFKMSSCVDCIYDMMLQPLQRVQQFNQARVLLLPRPAVLLLLAKPHDVSRLLQIVQLFTEPAGASYRAV